MSSWKGDSYYNAHVDVLEMQVSCSDTEEEDVKMSKPTYNEWVSQNYGVLEELYSTFQRSGSTVFGRMFYQNGTFGQFIDLIYYNSII